MTQRESIHHLSADAVTDQSLHAFLTNQTGELASHFIHSKRLLAYAAIVTMARARWQQKPKDVYVEKHHIVPRCMGGTDDKWNIVILTPREHYVCHRLLVSIVLAPYHKKLMKHACFYMLHYQANDQSSLSSRKYDTARKSFHSWLVTQANDPNRRAAISAKKLLYWANPANRQAQSARLKALDEAKTDAYRQAEQRWLSKASHDYWSTVTPEEKQRIYAARKKTAHNRGLVSYFDPMDYSNVGLYPLDQQPVGWVRGDPSLWRNGSPSKKTLARWSKLQSAGKVACS